MTFSIEDYAIPEPNTGCWLWAKRATIRGYGHIWYRSTHLLAHRVAYEAYRGPIPDGMFVCHKCDTPSCVNPDHLFLGTHADNMADRDRKGRTPIGEARPNARLTADLVREIRSARESGETLHSLGRRFGVSHTTVHRIAMGRKWSHVA